MPISLIVAAAANDIIGAGGALPWHLPDDFRWFRAKTLGKPVVMGRKTWESIGGPLPGRQNIVITRDSGYAAAGAEVVHTPEAAVAAAGDVPELMVIGGAEVFERFRPRASRLYLTRVDAAVDGDTRFPPPDPARWKLLFREPHAADERHAHRFEFRIYERKQGARLAVTGGDRRAPRQAAAAAGGRQPGQPPCRRQRARRHAP